MSLKIQFLQITMKIPADRDDFTKFNHILHEGFITLTAKKFRMQSRKYLKWLEPE